MTEALMAFLAVPVAKWGIVSILVVLFGHLLKKVPYSTMRGKISVLRRVGYGLGATTTLFLGGKFKYTKPFWNNLFEPVFKNILNNVIFWGIKELFEGYDAGLDSDNPKEEEK